MRRPCRGFVCGQPQHSDAAFVAMAPCGAMPLRSFFGVLNGKSPHAKAKISILSV
jgi:hypothetical protein